MFILPLICFSILVYGVQVLLLPKPSLEPVVCLPDAKFLFWFLFFTTLSSNSVNILEIVFGSLFQLGLSSAAPGCGFLGALSVDVSSR